MRAANLAVRFLLEITSIVMLAALAFSGGTPIAMRVAGLVGALAFVALWARYVAPKSSRRLADPARLVLELGLFASAAAASAVTVGAAVAAIFATVVLANEILLFVFRQRDR